MFSHVYLIKQLIENVISFPISTFINGFELYKNMYCFVIGIYAMLARLSIHDQQKSNNAYTIILGSYGSDFDKIMKCPQTNLRAFDCSSVFEINRYKQSMWAPVLRFIGDMKQQTMSTGFLRACARFCYWFCNTDPENCANLTQDMVTFGQYHYQVLNLQEKGNCISKKSKNMVSWQNTTSNPSFWLFGH